MDAKLLFRCADKIIQPGTTADENLMENSSDRIQAWKITMKITPANYISRYYYFGFYQGMYQIWNAVKRFQCESRELEERESLSRCVILPEEYSKHIGSVFESYIDKRSVRQR